VWQAGRASGTIIVVHVGLSLGLAMGILCEVGVHDSSSRGDSIVLSAHPHVVKHGSGIALEFVGQVVTMTVTVNLSVRVRMSVVLIS
jgi:hypothetical protein